LSRAADSLHKPSVLLHAITFRLLQLLVTLGLILCIVGGTSSYSSTGVYQPQDTTKAGIVLYIVAFVALCLLAGFILHKINNAPTNDKKLVWAVILALPFILVRIIYSLISVFSDNRHFNLLTGSVIIHVFMAVLEEMAVVVIYLVVGWMSETRPATVQGPIASQPWKGEMSQRGGIERQDASAGVVGADHVGADHVVEDANIRGDYRSNVPRGTGRLSKGRRRRGPIHALVGAGIDAVQARKEKKNDTNGL